MIPIKNKLLIFIRKVFRRKTTYFLKEYKKVEKNMHNTTKKDNIIVTPFKFDNSHIFEAIYSRKAILEGVNVYAFLCGQGVNKCEKICIFDKLKKIRCDFCYIEQTEFVRQFGVFPYYLNNELMENDKVLINQTIEDYFQKPEFSNIFMGVNIKTILKSALQRYYLKADPNMDDNHITRGFLNTILSTIIVLDRLCAKVNPKYVLSSHGTYSSWGAIVEYCKNKKIPVVVWGTVYNNGGIYFSNNESCIVDAVFGSDEEWQNKELSTKQESTIKDFLKMRTGQNTRFIFDYNKNQKDQLTREEICKKTGIPERAKIVGMFPNIPWDASIDGSIMGDTVAFNSYLEWLSTTLNYFEKRKDIYLIIRTHPAENDLNSNKETLMDLIYQIYEVLPKNIIILPAESAINSFALGKVSVFGIYYCSTIGMELTYLGVPLVCAGPSPLKNKGIVYDAKSMKEYIDLLERGIRGELVVTNENKNCLLKFGYYHMFTRVMPQTFFEYDDEGGFKNLLFDSEKEIKENKVLDHLYQTINNQGRYSFDKFY